jgi:hypothetical protein
MILIKGCCFIYTQLHLGVVGATIAAEPFERFSLFEFDETVETVATDPPTDTSLE